MKLKNSDNECVLFVEVKIDVFNLLSECRGLDQMTPTSFGSIFIAHIFYKSNVQKILMLIILYFRIITTRSKKKTPTSIWETQLVWWQPWRLELLAALLKRPP